MSKGGQKTVQTVQSNDPWSGIQPYMLDIFQRGQKQADASGFSPESNQAFGMISSRASAGSPLIGAGKEGLLSTINGNYLSPDSNPYLKQNVDTAMGQARAAVNENFTGDNYGNSAHQEWLARTLGQTAGQMYGDNYNRERGMQMQGILSAPSMAAGDYNDAQQLLGVGAAKEAKPWESLLNYARLVGGMPTGSGTTTGQQPYFTNPLGSAAGGALAGGAIGGPWGAGIGAGLGLLMGR
jgi:hypothetical protein